MSKDESCMSVTEKIESEVFSERDQRQFNTRGISPDVVVSQLETFERGIPATKLIRSCVPNDGIVKLTDAELKSYSEQFEAAAATGRVQKFVPASGAASRMFKQLLASYEQLLLSDKEADSGQLEILKEFIDNLSRFAFYDELKEKLEAKNRSLDELLDSGEYHQILVAILDKEGLDYRNMPKGMIAFHRYPDGSTRNPFEEHLAEATEYARDDKGIARVHFTVPAVHMTMIQGCVKRFAENFKDVEFIVTYSIQKPSTDTIAVDMQNRPFRNPDGSLLFRPGGHGALLENLNDLKGDIVFIKNVDNVVPDHLKPDTYLYKKALGGYLVSIQTEMFEYLKRLSSDDMDEASVTSAIKFAEEKLGVVMENVSELSYQEKCDALFSYFNRPLRVCGMVKNEGEPGGGPFWIQDSHGNIKAQIVETSQIDMENEEQNKIVKQSTHFNPVDLICGVRDFKGRNFHLPQFADPTTGFISRKSKNGRDLKALELPGLWNGAMAFWNTIFVEVPVSTFSPVKTVFDLLRPTHQQK